MQGLIIIVTWNGLRWLDRCLGSACQSGWDVLVVDNASADGTAEAVRNLFPSVRLLVQKENLGFGAANNIGLSIALREGYDCAYLLNQDAWVLPGVLDALVACQQAHPEFGILSPMQMQADGRMLDANFGTNFRRGTPVDGSLTEVSFVMAAHWLVSRACLEKTGFFSPVFYHYGEDGNYIDRAHFHGFKTGVLTSVAAVHDRGDRCPSVDDRMFQSAVALKRELSRPIHGSFWKTVCYRTALMFRDYCSLRPLHYVRPVAKARRQILACREQSRLPGAFILQQP